jgi:hypothetical protein
MDEDISQQKTEVKLLPYVTVSKYYFQKLQTSNLKSILCVYMCLYVITAVGRVNTCSRNIDEFSNRSVPR